jgi:putative membrane protein
MPRNSSLFVASLAVAFGLAPLPTLAQETRDQAHPPLGTASYTPAPSVKQEPLTSQTFASRAAAANLAEIELGQLALSKSDNASVKQFAQRMIKDHQAASAKLKGITATQKISLPATPDDEHRKLKQKLQQLAGADFDRQYIEAMTKDHADAIALFEAGSSAEKVSAELRQFASATLPTLKEHSEAVHRLSGRRSDGESPPPR